MAAVLKLQVPEQKILETAKATVKVARGKEKLTEYGMDETYFVKVDAEILTAAGFKTDEQIKSELKAVTNQKNSKLTEAGKWGDKVKTRLELAFPKSPEVIKEFPLNWTKAKRDETTMLEVIPGICGLIEKYSVKLKEKGLPDDYKQKGLDIRTEIDTLNTTQEQLKKLGPEYTQERIAAYTIVYDRVNEINKAGREAYAESAADLVLFKSPWPAAEKKTSKTNTTTDTKTA